MTLPWMMLSFLLFFVGMFVLVYFSMRNQDKALEQIMQQQKVLRMEFERLADALDELLEKHEVEDRDFDQASKPAPEKTRSVPSPMPSQLQPRAQQQTAPAQGVERLLLGPDTSMPTPKLPSSAHPAPVPGANSRSGGMPDLKF